MKLKILIIALITMTIHGLDNPHFYKASQFLYKTRFEEPWLTSGWINFAGGHSENSLNACGDETSLLNLYGEQDMVHIAENVPAFILDKNPDCILNILWQKTPKNCFGKLQFEGEFKVIDINFNVEQNFLGGFFVQINIPVRKLEINNIRFLDDSSAENAGNVNMADWTSFISNFKANLNLYGIIYNNNIKAKGFGDLVMLIGKTVNYENTQKLDFVDITAKTGVLFPTGKRSDPDQLFSLPTGYDGFWGIPILSTLQIGLFDWLTLGTYLNLLNFFSRTKQMRIKTAQEQNGQIKLLKDCVIVQKGKILTFGTYFEADHIAKGYSVFIGYQFNKEFSTTVSALSKLVNADIANTDSQLQGWEMQTLNFYLEYDFSNFENPNRPYLGIGVDIPFRGKNIIPSKMGTIHLTIDLGYEF